MFILMWIVLGKPGVLLLKMALRNIPSMFVIVFFGSETLLSDTTLRACAT